MDNVENTKKEHKQSKRDLEIVETLEHRLVKKNKKVIRNLKFKIKDKICLTANLTKDDVVLDLGGHVGNFTLDIYDKVKFVYIYEPFPANIAKLKENLDNNNVTNYKLIEAGVWENEPGDATFYFGEEDKGEVVSLIENRSKKQKVVLPMVNFEDVLNEYPDINVIKFDIEGAEYQIIKKYYDLIGNRIDKLGIEFHVDVLGRRTDLSKYYETEELLRKYYPYYYTSKGIIKKIWNDKPIEYFFNGTTFITCLKQPTVYEKCIKKHHKS